MRSLMSSPIWNVLAVVFVILTLCTCAYLGLIFLNPQSALNPFPPVPISTAVPTVPLPTLPPTASPTSTLLPLPPEWTATPEDGAPPVPLDATATLVGTTLDTPAAIASPTVEPSPTPAPSGGTATVGAPPPTTNPGGYPGAGTTATLPAATATTGAYP